ncbi:MAG TPA: GAF domain-containing sensor histidine kinase [Baekduia sp.]|nr:GAF domain-containing sensor histidine kinase [Baekduia sp.]
MTGARFAALGVLDAERDGLARFVASGVDEERRRIIGDPPEGRGVLGLLIDDPEPLRLHDVAAHPRAFGVPAGHPAITTFLGVPVVIGDTAWGNLYLANKEAGADFDEEDEWTAVVLARWAAIAIENARLYAALDTRRHELEHAVASLRAATEIAVALGAEIDREPVLDLIVKRARALVDARAVAVLLEAGDALAVVASAGCRDGAIADRVPAIGTRWGEVMASGAPLRVGDVAADDRFDPASLGAPDAATALLVPLSYRRATIGVLVAFDRLGRPADGFGDEDETLLRAFASSAAIAVVTAESVEKSRLRTAIAAAEAERGRWARELHDETLQSLGGLLVLLASAADGDDPERLRRATGTAVERVADEIANLRSIIAELRPAALDELGLVPALRALMRRTAGGAGLDGTVTAGLDERERLPPELETAVYRVAQEALTNVARHAQARRVALDVQDTGTGIRLTVTDDGRGYDAAAAPAGRGFGVPGMRERVALAGGTLTIAPGAPGTVLRAVFPRPQMGYSTGPVRPLDGPAGA